MKGSVRENVLMGQPLDAKFMGEVSCVALSHDMLLLVTLMSFKLICWPGSWILRGSVRDDVLMGQPYDAELMGEVSLLSLHFTFYLVQCVICVGYIGQVPYLVHGKNDSGR
jgi:hypothetical protein